ncbi:MAG: lactate utilization protein [Bacteroidetes bacterium]|nr:MAG: lactate utilization protein [Bacteroidota bacterium]
MNSDQRKQEIYRKQAERIIKHLRKRGMDGIYCDQPEEAVQAICSMIPAGSLVGLGGSETLLETGLVVALRRLDIRLLDRYRDGVTKEEVDQMRRECLQADIFIAGTNALTLDGQLVNMDGMGNRVACLIYGPKKVILLTGMNKVVATVEEGIARIKNWAAPVNAVRTQANSPCSKTGVCQDPACYPPNRICNQLVITEASRIKDRITVVLIGEVYGF